MRFDRCAHENRGKLGLLFEEIRDVNYDMIMILMIWPFTGRIVEMMAFTSEGVFRVVNTHSHVILHPIEHIPFSLVIDRLLHLHFNMSLFETHPICDFLTPRFGIGDDPMKTSNSSTKPNIILYLIFKRASRRSTQSYACYHCIYQ